MQSTETRVAHGGWHFAGYGNDAETMLLTYQQRGPQRADAHWSTLATGEVIVSLSIGAANFHLTPAFAAEVGAMLARSANEALDDIRDSSF